MNSGSFGKYYSRRKEKVVLPSTIKVSKERANKTIFDLINNFNLVKTITGIVTSVVNESVDSTTSGSEFRFDPTNQQWIFNMSTKALSAGKTYFYKISLNDGTNIDFSFGLK